MLVLLVAAFEETRDILAKEVDGVAEFSVGRGAFDMKTRHTPTLGRHAVANRRRDEEGEKGEELSGDASRKWWAREDSRDVAMRGGWEDVRGLLRHWDRMCVEWKKSVTDACKMPRET